MPIPPEVADVIAKANTQKVAEETLDALRTERAELQARIASLNTRITNQITAVQQARQALKLAAQAL